MSAPTKPDVEGPSRAYPINTNGSLDPADWEPYVVIDEGGAGADHTEGDDLKQIGVIDLAANLIRAYREHAHASQEEIADLCGVVQPRISDILNGKNRRGSFSAACYVIEALSGMQVVGPRYWLVPHNQKTPIHE